MKKRKAQMNHLSNDSTDTAPRNPAQGFAPGSIGHTRRQESVGGGADRLRSWQSSAQGLL